MINLLLLIFIVITVIVFRVVHLSEFTEALQHANPSTEVQAIADKLIFEIKVTSTVVLMCIGAVGYNLKRNLK